MKVRMHIITLIWLIPYALFLCKLPVKIFFYRYVDLYKIFSFIMSIMESDVGTASDRHKVMNKMIWPGTPSGWDRSVSLRTIRLNEAKLHP